MRPADGGMSVDLPDLWLQGRTVFGGLQAAVLVRAMRAHCGPDVPLRSLQISFVAPVPAGRVLVTTRLLRQGKSVSHVEARITLDGQDACVGVGIFGAARESKLAIVPSRPLATAKPEADSKPLPFIPGRSPAFAEHVEMRFGAGRFPFTGGSEP
ncbi:MAG TPA: thioesterase family protein, partial [Nevskiaceae bacterium]|nr:thioesterase family protein [Nevskiaceae bacterium]